MHRIVVTGGSGKLGQFVLAELIEHGYAVYNLDRQPGADPQISTIRVDLTDYGQVVEALSGIDDQYDGVDALVHLAAVPAPGLTGNAATFDNNIMAGYHVFAAARLAKVKTVVWASSETVLGLPFTPENPPPYFPVDEQYHPRPHSSYSLAKTAEEELARQFCRWDPELRMAGLRFSNVMGPWDYEKFADYDKDPVTRSWNGWGYIDGRDGAQAVRKALEACDAARTTPRADGAFASGYELFVIANADTVSSRPSAELAATVFPEVEVRTPLTGNSTLLSIEKARRILGFEPEHGWRGRSFGFGGAN